MYSVETENEAEIIVYIACKTTPKGEYYAPELIDPETRQPRTGDDRIHHFVEFGLRLEKLHKQFFPGS